MAIDDILKALDDQAQADCEAVVGESREHAKLIIEEAQLQADQIHATFVRQIERVARSQASKTVNAARLEAKMMESSVKGGGVVSVFDAASLALPTVRESGYEVLFAALASEALEGVSGSVTVHVASNDGELAKKAVAAAGLTADIVEDLDSAGGLVVDTENGRIIRRNTLESRLDRARQFVQADVARVLFS